MAMLVTLQEAKDHLRVDTTAEDADIELKIMGASQVVINYLALPSPFWADQAALELAAPESVKIAVLLLVGILYRDRDGVEMGDWEFGYLPFPVTSLLYHYRTPVFR